MIKTINLEKINWKSARKSLNEHLLKGSNFLNNLVGILLKFREWQFAIKGDIAQMYH